MYTHTHTHYSYIIHTHTHLARGRHFDPEHGVGAWQTLKGELRDFDRHVRELLLLVADCDAVRGVGVDHGLGCELCEVDVQDLGGERERARATNVGLDHLECVYVCVCVCLSVCLCVCVCVCVCCVCIHTHNARKENWSR